MDPSLLCVLGVRELGLRWGLGGGEVETAWVLKSPLGGQPLGRAREHRSEEWALGRTIQHCEGYSYGCRALRGPDSYKFQWSEA